MKYVAIAFVLEKVNFEMEEKNTMIVDMIYSRTDMHTQHIDKEIMDALLLLFTSTCN